MMIKELKIMLPILIAVIVFISFMSFLIYIKTNGKEKCVDAAMVDYGMDSPTCSYNHVEKECGCGNEVCKSKTCEMKDYKLFYLK